MKKLFNSKAKIILTSVVSILLIIVVTGFLFCKHTQGIDNNTCKTVVKLDIPEITDKQKGSIIEINIPYDLYKDRENPYHLQSDFIGRNPDNTLTLLPDNKVLYLVLGRSIIIDFNKEIAYTNSHSQINHYSSSKPLLLPDGKVYLFKEIFDSKLNKFIPISSMIHKLASRTATLLPDKKILVTGGFDQNLIKHSDAELFNPQLSKYTITSKMYAKRAQHSATLLNNGKVLIVGGNSKNEPYAELYNYKSGKFYPIENNGKTRCRHTATLLSDGRVLIIGGTDKYFSTTTYSDIEIFDPKSNKFKQIGHLIYPNSEHSSILLKTNKVFITGGKECNKKESLICDAQLFDLKTNKTSLVPNASLWQASALMLEDGSILIVSNSYLAVKNKIRLFIP